jgi:drug/metabolite transporter (DMT)-like permease
MKGDFTSEGTDEPASTMIRNNPGRGHAQGEMAMTLPQWLLAIGFGLFVVGIMVATVAQGNPAGRYVMLGGLVPIVIGGCGALLERLRAQRHR